MADQLPYEPYIPADQSPKEFSLRAVLLGVVMAVVLGAANAYIGMVAGLTIAATFPAAVVAMAALRPMGGTILEENIARTTASVGEALVAGAIFTIPAFVITGVWTTINLWISTFIMMVGGILGVLFVIILRRTLVEESGLPFPESIAASEIHKAGQAGASGGKYLLAAGLMSAFIELLKNGSGIRVLASEMTGWWGWGKAMGERIGGPVGSTYTGGMFASTPSASPALLGVGYIIGPSLAAVVFAGGVLGWWCLVPVMTFVNRDLMAAAAANGYGATAMGVVWQQQVRPLAVGTMVVGAAWTLWRMRKSLGQGFGRVFADLRKVTPTTQAPNRHETDIRYKWIVFGIFGLLIPIAVLYYYFTKSFGGSILAALVMVVAGILFAAVAGYLVGLIGSSNNPISGLTLSTLILAALLMVAIGLKGDQGVLAVLGVAAVVCTAMGIAGDMMQDLKVGHILGGTPKSMEMGEMIAVIAAAPALAFVLALLSQAYGFAGAPGANPATALPAPQAGLMALVSTGIINGQMPWPLFIAGMLFAVMLILVRAPSVMLVAVGMYLPIWSTFAIFVGGVFRWIVDRLIERRHAAAGPRARAENTGVLVASGLVAGEALMGVIIAGIIVANMHLPVLVSSPLARGLLGLLVFPLVLWFFYSTAKREADKVA